MFRKSVLILAAACLSAGFTLIAEIGTAGAAVNPPYPGTVTCTPAHGVWSGVMTFSPALMLGGTANVEKIVVKASLGNTASPCVTNTGVIALGSILGTITLSIAGHANDCATIFSGTAITPAVAKFKMTWTSPAGANPTLWTQAPSFKFKGAPSLAKINVTLGHVSGSFSPSPGTASLSDTNWPGASGAVATGCTASSGLGSLTLSTSKGKW
jgi:hypothetical protein